MINSFNTLTQLFINIFLFNDAPVLITTTQFHYSLIILLIFIGGFVLYLLCYSVKNDNIKIPTLNELLKKLNRTVRRFNDAYTDICEVLDKDNGGYHPMYLQRWLEKPRPPSQVGKPYPTDDKSSKDKSSPTAKPCK